MITRRTFLALALVAPVVPTALQRGLVGAADVPPPTIAAPVVNRVVTYAHPHYRDVLTGREWEGAPIPITVSNA